MKHTNFSIFNPQVVKHITQQKYNNIIHKRRFPIANPMNSKFTKYKANVFAIGQRDMHYHIVLKIKIKEQPSKTLRFKDM